ncbi:DUF2634 domain-containing protein [Bacillus chungangensis]|uniref:DUF2634 domain-containing protein n=1 Tax=Bacillus chungangensis TaxID=587633 RepID=A0ABT9WRR0_9BACI|nr:DUF2634 domain-containing protein [Bacillus chungangensis]MDQ0175976.1 hypothetical protein [Bacillus chungangensis]
MIIPEGGSLEEQRIKIEKQPSLTYKIDFNKNRVIGMTDDLDAIKQTVFITLHTERFQYLIFTDNFGAELDSLIGTNRLFIQSELKRRVTEALLQDDRITSVEGFKFTFSEGDVLVRFTVVTEYGSFEDMLEVKRNV